MDKILVINGPNLNLLGKRDPAVYGSETYDDLCAYIKNSAEKLGFSGCEVFQSNHEGAIIDEIHAADGNFCGIIINAGAYTHYSYAIRDAIDAVKLPVIEVHLSNVYSRDEFRQKSVIAPVCKGSIAGFGKISYYAALCAMKELL
ncbi:MAG: type II 3-dehydroquinate dehydratase [Ruminococcus sp.]|jgi:3-dehydroquinate dehydratase-2|nr:type II 3-dehydroquinate dehydratase [Ruminococcus sp.]